MSTILVTDASQYAGPGTVNVLLNSAGQRVLCHDSSFRSPAARDAFLAAHPEAECVECTDAAGLAAELLRRGIELDAVVLNNAYPISRAAIGEISLDDFRNTFEAVFLFPVQLAQLLLPAMKARRGGCFVFVTSARPLRPEFGFAVPTSIRAATTHFALAMAKEVASFGIQVNIVGPNYLYSEMYYPRSQFVNDPDGRAKIAATVPAGRLGSPEEIGELIAFLVSGRSQFVTGQVLYFTGGWP